MKKTTAMDLELGQMAFGNPVEKWTVPDYLEALFEHLFWEIQRVYWNINQMEWERGTDLKFGKITINSYYWGEDDKKASEPNFIFNKVELRWYKYFGRSMTVNVMKTEKQWIKWFNECLKYIRNQDKKVN